MKKFEVFVAEMGWSEPVIPFDRPVTALYRQLAYIDWLANQCGLGKQTVAQYYSNLKMFYLRELPFRGIVDTGPWGPAGTHPTLVSVALHDLPSKPRLGRMAIPRSWIREGFDEWPRDIFVCIFLIHGWLGRKCEFLESQTPAHQLTWGMVEFLFVDKVTGAASVMPRVQVHTTACDMVRLKPESRKAQEKFNVRQIPGRLNFTHLSDVSTGLDNWHDGDMATAIQAHYVQSRVFCLSESE